MAACVCHLLIFKKTGDRSNSGSQEQCESIKLGLCQVLVGLGLHKQIAVLNVWEEWEDLGWGMPLLLQRDDGCDCRQHRVI